MKEGEKGPKASVEGIGMLVTSTDWQMRVDLRQRMEFPLEVAVTNKRPATVIWSATTKQAILLEMKVSWEDINEIAKSAKA